MIQRATYILFFFFFSALSTQAQSEENPRKFFPKSFGEITWRPMLAYDNKHTYLDGVNLMTPGVRIGLEHRGVMRYNIGFARFAITEKLILPRWDIPDCSSLFGKINHRGYFGMLYFERAIFRIPKWEISIPNYLQVGKIKATSISDSQVDPIYDVPFLGLATSLQVEYYILPWLSPKVSIGYRHSFFMSESVPDSKMFNSLFWGVALRTNWGLLYKTLKERKQLRSE